MDTTALTKAVSDLQAVDTELAATVTQAFTDLGAEITNLEAAIAANDQPAIDAAVASLSQIKADLGAISAQAVAADPGEQTPPPPPVETPVLDPATQLPLYVPPAGATIDPTVWVTVTDVTGDNAAPLYTFASDTPGNPPTGVVDGWTLFQGTPTPVAPA